MKKILFVLPLLCAITLPACIKSVGETAVRGDGTASCKMSVGYKKETFDNLKAMIEAQMGGGDEDGGGDKITEAFGALETAFSDKKIADEWKALGVEVTKASANEKDGWKLVEVEGTIKNVPEYSKKADAALKAMKEEAEKSKDNPAAAMSSIAKSAIPVVPKFYKTDKPDIAKLVIVPRTQDLMPSGDEDNPLDRLDEMDDEQREMIEAQLDQMRGLFALDEMKIETKVKVPGKILSVNGLKQEGEDTVIFQLLGTNLSLDTIKGLRSKAGHSATFQFKPEEFKIVLEDEPKAESKPATRPVEKKPAKNEDEKKQGEEDGDK